jgi:2-C-methyl-D-erythritol 4-phosphate cytidylyltransferase
MRAAVIVPAAGQGRRMGSLPKAFLPLAGRPVIAHALEALLHDDRVTQAVIAIDAAQAADPPPWLTQLDPRVCIVAGGQERTGSVRNALATVASDIDVVLIHDAARPLVSRALVKRALDEAGAGRSVTAAIPVADTVHEVGEDGRVVATPDRSRLWRAQTPQAFPHSVLRDAYARAAARDVEATDDAALVARFGVPVFVIEGEPRNLKITVPDDLRLARAWLQNGT